MLSLAFASLACFNNQQRVEGEVVELAQMRIDQFGHTIRDLLDSTDPLAPAVLEERFVTFRDESSPVVVNDGYFVLVRMYDQSGQQLVNISDESFPAIAAVRQAVDNASIEQLDADEYYMTTTHVDHGMGLTGRASWLKDSQADLSQLKTVR